MEQPWGISLQTVAAKALKVYMCATPTTQPTKKAFFGGPASLWRGIASEVWGRVQCVGGATQSGYGAAMYVQQSVGWGLVVETGWRHGGMAAAGRFGDMGRGQQDGVARPSKPRCADVRSANSSDWCRWQERKLITRPTASCRPRALMAHRQAHVQARFAAADDWSKPWQLY